MGKLLSLDTMLNEKFDHHISRGTIRNWCSEGRFPFVSVGTRVLFDADEVERWLDERRQESTALRARRQGRAVK